MSTGGVIMMICTMSIVTAFTGYFFIKVLRSPTHSQSDDDKTTPSS